MNQHTYRTAVALMAVLAGLAATPLAALAGDDCGYDVAPTCRNASCRGDCHNCRRHRHEHHGHHKCRVCDPPHGVVLPSAPALYFGASTLSVVPAGFASHWPAPPPPMGAPRNLCDADLQNLFKLWQLQQSQGAAAQPNGAQGAAPAAQGADGSVDERLAKIEQEVAELRARVQEHTSALADIIASDPELSKKYQVQP
jgi:hypothetical protein